MIASLMSSGILFGEWCGRELNVGMPILLSFEAFLHHFVIVPGLTPKCLAVFLMPQPERTFLTAFILTLGMYGLVIYMLFILAGCFQAIETERTS